MKSDTKSSKLPQLIAALLTFALLLFVHLRVKYPVMLMAERFFKGVGGYVEIVVLSFYAYWLTGVMLKARRTETVRRKLWLLFSVVFFAQFVLGIAGWETFLMTGKLHIPVPALIIAGPLYRGHSFFMLILFLSTVIIAGPIWCSYLCYIGAWDNLAASKHKFARLLPKWTQFVRIGILLLVVLTAILLRISGVGSATATALAITFGLIGVGIMVFVSRKTGYMAHCTTYCPIGLLSVLLGKINPFRVYIDTSCEECFICVPSCRYGALTNDLIRKRKVGFNCTLCGDCVSVCPHRVINYKFAFWRGDGVRKAFIVVAITLHTVFLAFARI